MVLVEEVHRAVVGHVHVGVAVEVVIREGHAQAAPLVNDSHFQRHIAELAVFVAVEHIAYRLVELRLAIGANAALGTDDIVLRVKLHIIGRVKIQIAVEIVVQKAATSTPPGIGPTHGGGRIGKAPAALVAQQAVGTNVGHIEIYVSIRIVVSGGTAHAVTGVPSSRDSRHIGETASASVVVQAIGGNRIRALAT